MANVTSESMRPQEGFVKKSKGRQGTSLAVVIVISIGLVALTLICVQYIRIHSRYVSSSESVADLQTQLAQLKEDNDAYYSSILSDLDLNELKKIAISRFGMKVPDESQKDTYTMGEGNANVRQYVEISDE